MTKKTPPIDDTNQKGKTLRKNRSKSKTGREISDHDLWEKVATTITPYAPDKMILKEGAVSKEDTRASKSPAEKTIPEKKAQKETQKKSISKPTSSAHVIRPIQPSSTAPLDSLDRKTLRKVQQEKLLIEDTLDLHGLTQIRAHTQLKQFIKKAVAQNKRQLLIITGKGDKMQGVLRRMLPIWLEDADLRPYVLGLTPAHIKHGGSGAFYLRLKRKK